MALPASATTNPTASSSSTSNDSNDEQWYIDIDIMLPEGKENDNKGFVMISKKFPDGQSRLDQVLVPLNRHQQHQGWAQCGYSAGCILETIEYSRSQLKDRVTIYVGKDEIAVKLPSIFLTATSMMFRAAFEGSGAAKFAEGVSKSMNLPEVDIEIFMVLVRCLIHQLPTLDLIQEPAWPFPCAFCEEPNCSQPGLQHHGVEPSMKQPIAMRVCSLLDQLGFELPDCVFQGIYGPMLPSPRFLLSPPLIQDAMENSLDGGYTQQYIAKSMARCLGEASLTPFRTYKAILKEYPDLAISVLESMSGAVPSMLGIRLGEWIWNESEGKWEPGKPKEMIWQ